MDPRALSQLMYLGRLPKTRQELEENLRFCHVCLREGKLTREHVPPRSAFNDRDLLWDHCVVQASKHYARKARFRGGFWTETLCKACNNQVCAPYARAYVDFVHDLVSAPRLLDARGSARLICIKQNTLFIAKQIATMILAIEPVHFARHHPRLREFVLDPKMQIDPAFRVLGFLVPNDARAGTISQFHARVASFAPGYQFAGGEISWYPFGFVYTAEIGPEYDPGQLTDITHWFHAMPSSSSGTCISFHVRLTAVDAISVGMGNRRLRPQIDFLNGASLLS